jgi:hypothetical protein
MRSITVQLDDAEFSRLEGEAARRGRAPEALAHELVMRGLAGEGARGATLVREIGERFGLIEAEGERFARELVGEAREDRRAAGRP